MPKRINIYIDGNNLYRSAKDLGFAINYKKLRGWLRQKYKSENIFLFIGFVEERSKFYQYLERSGFILIFKQTITTDGAIKGNCDAELILKTVSDFYTKAFDLAILITGDGDFGCIVEFLHKNNAIERVLAPNRNKCSLLLRNKGVDVTFLNDHYSKFASTNEKAPDADASA